MAMAILLLAAFQGYWLRKLYRDEYLSLNKEVDVSFREAMNKLQLKRFETDTALIGKTAGTVTVRTKSADKSSKTTNGIAIRPVASGRPARVIYRNLGPDQTLSQIPADSIESVTVRSGFSFKGAPPPGLIELILKRKQELGDSAKFSIRVDSFFTNTRTDDHKEAPKSNFFTYNLQIKDSGQLRHMRDSMLKIAGRIMPGAVATIRFKPKPDSSRSARTDSAVIGKKITPAVDRIFISQPHQEPLTNSPIVAFLSNNKTINDSIPVKSVDSAYRSELNKLHKQLNFSILFKSYKDSSMRNWNVKRNRDSIGGDVVTSEFFVGYNTPYAYQAKFTGTNNYVLRQMQMQIGGSVLLLLIVIGAFVIMYRNMMAQQRLANIKNDFISNITHELKTPIATVGVAIEALRNFNAIQSPERTREYLDISAAELQRLSLLVDKVLKLSMFEKKQIELNKEPFDLKELVEETLHVMKLQFEKNKASVQFEATPDSFMIEADKLHITSVIYNLLDNALKYSPGKPSIQISLSTRDNHTVILTVRDNGMGIASQHQLRIFEKFFRVPTGNQHNIKGYGLGLSYVAEVVKSHHGHISVQSQPGEGSSFVVELPARSI